MWDFAEPVDDFDLIYRVDRGRQPTVDAEYLVVDDYTKSKEVKHIGEVVPDIGIAVFSGTLCVKAI